ncbi:MAG TPA: dTDP-4-dehydrorhamnose reductase [Thermodesulfobium narugense]|uniref:dTDP-4-dehydrorhamnose reductase n=1 Tax=Thermodesulfobium acidiphilum TaxID=1794699 RepID=A0A2R4VYA6_THEAF|nr:dTDP-4-dehydrorhamnose reductase [Thermodesulfobium acidiphilum]AWB09444.1 dTDP-4-dehydrorhamnose reductase [Thermodesulfobium acidiphilum]PMP85453.1 MAG: dTDP-4-dehydrorhamnose reductase [Thermodesulfobium narugense]HEM55282.1 dTDP-4-dehydrorhamnose reductase [Thermodesulfobium narugense]
MKAILLGSNGQLAKEFVNNSSNFNLELISFSKDKLDITNFFELKEAIKRYMPDVVLNCAAYNYVDKAESDWQAAYRVNALGPRNLAVLSNEFNYTLVHFSSDYVFDGTSSKPYLIYDEPNPISIYGRSKLSGEREVSSLCSKYYIIRTSWVFGDGPNSFPKKLIEWSKGKDNLKVVCDQFSSPTSARYLASKTMFVVGNMPYGTYHITNSGYCSRFEWAKFIFNFLKIDIEIVPVSSDEFMAPAKRPLFSVLDNFPLSSDEDWKDSTINYLSTSFQL